MKLLGSRKESAAALLPASKVALASMLLSVAVDLEVGFLPLGRLLLGRVGLRLESMVVLVKGGNDDDQNE